MQFLSIFTRNEIFCLRLCLFKCETNKNEAFESDIKSKAAKREK